MPRSLSLWIRVGVVAALGVVVITTVAAVDRERKIRAMHTASVAEWYCAHRGTRCDEEKSDAIEDRWAQRERVYKTAAGVFLVVGGIAAIVLRRRRR